MHSICFLCSHMILMKPTRLFRKIKFFLITTILCFIYITTKAYTCIYKNVSRSLQRRLKINLKYNFNLIIDIGKIFSHQASKASGLLALSVHFPQWHDIWMRNVPLWFGKIFCLGLHYQQKEDDIHSNQTSSLWLLDQLLTYDGDGEALGLKMLLNCNSHHLLC